MPDSKLEALFVIPARDTRRTFGADDHLPSLPLPGLRHTLGRYLDSLKPFLTSEEYGKSVKLVRLFEEGVGRTLHEKLKRKADTERNWVERWWEEIAYLQVRLPLIPYCSMDGVMPKNIRCWSYGSEEDQIKHASIFSHYLIQYWKLLRDEKLLPTQTSDKKTIFSMSQYRRLFNTVRIPGDKVDSLVSFFKTASEGFCPTSVIIICRGRLFCVDAVDSRGNPKTPTEWEEIVKRILNICSDTNEECRLGILTCDTRSNWSKNRAHLKGISVRNKELLDLIDRSLFVLVLDDASPETESEVSNCNLCGDYGNRWCDKSMSMIFYKNGRCGSICEHTAYDGIVVINCHHYVLTAMEESTGEWGGGQATISDFQELKFDLDETIRNEINRVKLETSKNQKREILMTRHIFEDYGKAEIQRLKFHPDSYVQMCLQLAYFRVHRKPGPCYETATTRKFYNGRTETVRCCTTQCLAWVVSMLDPKSTNEERRRLLERAVRRHEELMNEARENAGCDRHLFGMYCVALEEGLPIPDLYLDPSYLKSGGGGNFVLSTSSIGYTPLGGGVAPMCENGYGIFYNFSPDRIFFTVSANTRSSETNAEKFFEALRISLRETRRVLLLTARTSKF